MVCEWMVVLIVAMLAEQHSVAIEVARAALIASGGDAITASGKLEDARDAPVDVSTLMAREAEAQLNRQFEETLRHQQQFSDHAVNDHKANSASSPAIATTGAIAPTITTPSDGVGSVSGESTSMPSTATMTTQTSSAAAAATGEVAPTVSVSRGSTMTTGQRVEAVWSVMFTSRYAQTYFTAKPRTDGAPPSSLTAADVDTCICMPLHLFAK
jgi:hypothetical protein